MKIEVIVTEDGVFIPDGPMHKLVDDADVGRALRVIALNDAPDKPKRKRGPNKRKALGKGIEKTEATA